MYIKQTWAEYEENKLMTFGKKTANMFSSVIESVREIKILGVTISDSMKWDKHILSAVKSAYSTLYL